MKCSACGAPLRCEVPKERRELCFIYCPSKLCNPDMVADLTHPVVLGVDEVIKLPDNSDSSP